MNQNDGIPDGVEGDDAAHADEAAADEDVTGAPQEAEPPGPDADEVAAATKAAEEACREILARGGFDLRVLAVPGTPIRVEVQGPDAGRIIGRQGYTLQALQYLVSRIVGRRVSRFVAVKVDVEGYRVRRENTLVGLANRLAGQAVRDGRPVEMDPMPADERRIVHMALAQDPDVETRSEGERDERRIVIVPIREGVDGNRIGPEAGGR